MFTSKKLQTCLIVVVILIAAFFRFWQIRDYVVFLGDEGRDMIVMRNMFLEKKLVFLGPTASVGGFYLGPIYYWMAAPFLLLSRFDPVGPSYMVATFGVATVYLLFRFLKETAGFTPAIIISLLYATAPLIVRYSRSSWNPNPLPFFSLLLIYFLYLAISRKKYIYYVLAGASFGIAIQLHYLSGVLLAITAAIILTNTNIKKWIPLGLSILVGALVTFFPFLAFEFKNNFPNFITIREFVTRGTTVGFRSNNIIWTISNLGNILIEELSNYRGKVYTKLLFWILTTGGLLGLWRNWKNEKQRLAFSIGLLWFLGGLAGLRFYSGQIFDYYFGFMFPAPFFLAGLVISLFWKNKIAKVVTVLIAALVLWYFMTHSFYNNPPNRLINQTEDVADFVIEKSGGAPFNFALITDHNS
ncbi:MAG: glycosyltransferase family 39 protein, partial [Candidatus Curtissbacteria bacterium]|nr:glycosyltransferase family 39 protein [Candidatus Curtissbacteria bacterium]